LKSVAEVSPAASASVVPPGAVAVAAASVVVAPDAPADLPTSKFKFDFKGSNVQLAVAGVGIMKV
jgi:hypothetical protein